MDDLASLNTTNLSTVSDQFPYDYAFAVVYLFVQTPLCTFGMILNVLNICVFSQPAFSAPAYIMMKFLSLADAITLGVRIPQGLILFQLYGEAMAVNLLSPDTTGSDLCSNSFATFHFIYASQLWSYNL
ncbi:hypothetical protein T265_12623, partial [Opisthorchis viverrini]